MSFVWAMNIFSGISTMSRPPAFGATGEEAPSAAGRPAARDAASRSAGQSEATSISDSVA